MTRCSLLVLALVAVPFAADAQSFRCVGKDGKKYYGEAIPPQCVGQPIEQLNKQGLVTRRIDAQQSEAERLAKEAEEKKKKEEEALAKDEARRNRALLATYTSERDIEEARIRALADNEKAVKEIEARVGNIKKRQGELTKELDFYKGKNQPPAKLQQDVKNAEIDLTAQQGLLDAKKKEVSTINARYDEDKKRFAELTRKK
jgi:predicted transcriptional regulator